MAILRDEGFEDSKTEVEFSLYPDNQPYLPSGNNWMYVHLRFLFNERFPEISIRRNGQDETDVGGLIDGLHRLIAGEIPLFEFEPTEPDYKMTISREAEDSFLVHISIDSGGTSGGTYASSGPAVLLWLNSEGLRCFAEELSTEFAKLRSTPSGS
ncbi:MAG: hypothetical protein HY211_01615 [Candidatus Omnitrophica bacterium]|nr:hypothetical protein [Candidatus Omnitrophota bacterium]